MFLKILSHYAGWVGLSIGFAAPAAASDSLGCGSLHNAYGPFDYTNPQHFTENLPIVEKFHFTNEVERLEKGRSGTVPADLDYTLRAFPNHHRALYAMMKLQLAQGQQIADKHQIYSIQCYLERAIALQPKDATSFLLYGIYLHKIGKLEASEEKYLASIKLRAGAAETHYNLGLLYADMKQWKKAQEQALLAQQLGYPLKGLQARIQKNSP